MHRVVEFVHLMNTDFAFRAIVIVCVVAVTMLIASVIRAFQRWEILPDPLLPPLLRRIWYSIEKYREDRLYYKASGRRPDRS